MDSVKGVVERMKFLRPSFELRQQWSYNNLVRHPFIYYCLRALNIQMFILTVHIISHYTGQPYTSFVKDRIFTPLNMTSTTYTPSEAIRLGEVTQSWTKSGRRIPEWFNDGQVELNAGPGGVISNAEDLVRRLARITTRILNLHRQNG